MRKGVVMEIGTRHMIVLTKDGEFIRAKLNSQAGIGEEIIFSRVPLYSFSHLYEHKLYSLPLAAAIVLMLFFPISSLFESNKVYGVVSLDMDPSIEVAVDSRYEVLYMSGYNNKGKELLEGLSTPLEGMSLENSATILVEEGLEQGFIESSESLYISSPLDFNKDDNWGIEFGSWTAEMIDKYGFDIQSIYVEASIAEKAKQLSISPIKFLLLVQHNGEFDAQEMTNKSISDIEIKVGKTVQDVIHNRTSALQ